jgi:uncharacterized protein YbjT (DUF2867 family)
MSNQTKIAVIGATGMLGKPVTSELVNAGFQVTAVVRNLEQARKLLPPSVTLIKGDLKDPASIGAALRGQNALYLNLSVEQTEKESAFHTEGEGLRNAISAASMNGIRRISYLSSIVLRYPTDWWVFRLKLQAVEAVKASGIPYTIFYPSIFMETIKGQYVIGNRFLIMGKALYPNWWIAAKDYGLQVASDFRNQNPGNREYVVQGPEPLLTDEAAEQFARFYKKGPVKIVKLPIGPFRLLRPVAPRFRYGYEIINALNNYPERFEAQKTWDELGKPAITLREYAQNL